MGVDLYYMAPSAPCRSVLLAGKAMDVGISAVKCDLMKGDHLKPEFIKMNPQHTVPTLNDNGFCIWERIERDRFKENNIAPLYNCRAILTYLANKYDTKGCLYPKEPQRRAIVDQRLYFDMGTLYERFGKCVYPLMFGKANSVDEEDVTKLKEALQFLDGFIGDNGYTADKCMTIADFALVSTVSTIEAAGLVDLAVYPNVHRWLTTCKSEMADYQQLNQEGADFFGNWFKEKKDASA